MSKKKRTPSVIADPFTGAAPIRFDITDYTASNKGAIVEVGEPMPFSIVVDTREQQRHGEAGAYDFESLGYPTIRQCLSTGDYSASGHTEGPGALTIERKSLSDLFGTLFGGRDRFEAEVERMRSYERAIILVEGTMREVVEYAYPKRVQEKILASGVSEAQLAARPRAAVNSLLSYLIDEGVHILFADRDRKFCARTVVRLCEKFWHRKHPREKQRAIGKKVQADLEAAKAKNEQAERERLESEEAAGAA